MTLDAREAYCLEILTKESDKLSQGFINNQGLEISEWDSVEFDSKPLRVSKPAMTQTRSPRSSRKWTCVENSIEKSLSPRSNKRQEESLANLYSLKSPTALDLTMKISDGHPRSIIQVHSIGFNPLRSKINRRATTANKQRNEVYLPVEHSPKSFSPCKCVVSILRTKSYHCSPNCINKILSRQHKEYYSEKLSLINKLQPVFKNKEKNTFLHEKTDIKNSRSKESFRITTSPRSSRDNKMKTNPWIFITDNKLDLFRQKTDYLTTSHRHHRTFYASKRNFSHFD